MPFLCSAPAYADNAAEKPAPDFDGPWAGVVFGYDRTELPGADGADLMHGLQIGYNIENKGWVFGIESEIGSSNSQKIVADFKVPGDYIRVEYGRDFYLVIRPGRKMDDNTMLYGKIGYANSSMKYRYSGPAEYNDEWADSGKLHGVLVGVGLEFRTDAKAFVKTEYRYANFRDGLYRHQAVLGVGVRF